jgi:hypothetical protein
LPESEPVSRSGRAGRVQAHAVRQYSLKEVRETYCCHAQAATAGRGGIGDGAALSERRARLADAQAEKVEMANSIQRGEFVSVKAMRTMLESAFINIRETALSTAGRVSDAVSVHTIEDRAAVFKIIDYEMRETLTALSTVDTYAAVRAVIDNDDDDEEEA